MKKKTHIEDYTLRAKNLFTKSHNEKNREVYPNFQMCVETVK